MEQYGLEDSAYLPRRSKEEDVTDVAELGAASRSRKTNLTKEDVATEPLTVTMAKFKSVNFPGDTRPKLKIYFSDYDKPYISNVSNIDTLTRIMQSTQVKDWVGEKIMLYFDPYVEFEDRNTGGIRLCAVGELPADIEDYYSSLKLPADEKDEEEGEQE